MIKTGRGIAISWYGTGYGNGFPDVSMATIELREDGKINLRVGASEVGQGAKTIMPQICAESIGVAYDDVIMLHEDTRDFEDSGTAAASRQTYNTGNAVKRAADAFAVEILDIAQELLGLNSNVGFEIKDGVISLKMLPSKNISFAEIAKKLKEKGQKFEVSRQFVAQTTTVDPETGQGAPYWPYTFNAFSVEVDVDTSTGRVHVKEAWCAQDVGRAINPELCEGQIDGGFVMGQGYA